MFRLFLPLILLIRLPLQGLEAEAEYELVEPLPNNVTQSTGTLMIIETAGESNYNEFSVFLNTIVTVFVQYLFIS
jgi:hypothetical protein